MKIHRVIIIIFFIPVILFGADWEKFNVKITSTGESDEKNSTSYTLTDDRSRNFEVNYSTIPDEITQKKVIALKDLFYSWERINIKRIQFYFSPDTIYANLHIGNITYKDEDLLPYLPAGLAFHDTKEGLYYRFRIIVKNKSYMLEGIYTGEEDLLRAIYNFIKEQEGLDKSLMVRGKGPDDKAGEDKLKKADGVKHRLSFCAYGNYLLPTGKLATLFSGGYGGMAGIVLHDAGISITGKTLFRLDFTLASGYWRYSVKEDAGDITSCSISSSFIIPISLTARYRIPFMNDFFAAPMLSVGFNYNSIDYFEPVSGAADKAVKIREWAPSLLGGVELGYSVIKDKFTIIAGAQYTGMYERYMTTSSFVFHAGVEYSFMVFGD